MSFLGHSQGKIGFCLDFLGFSMVLGLLGAIMWLCWGSILPLHNSAEFLKTRLNYPLFFAEENHRNRSPRNDQKIASGPPCGPCWGSLRPSSGRLGGLLGHLEAILGLLGAILWACWGSVHQWIIIPQPFYTQALCWYGSCRRSTSSALCQGKQVRAILLQSLLIVWGVRWGKRKNYHRHHQHLSIISYYKNTGATKQPLT